MTAAALAALRRLRAPSAAARPPGAHPSAAACEFCALPLGEPHDHVVTLASGDLVCACTACALLFEGPEQPMRRLPRDARFLPGFDLEPQEWASLMIPVKLAFILVHAPSGAVHARYPGPGGVVAAPIESDTWTGIVQRHPELESITPGLEALLLNYMQRPHQLFITPLDQCYRLAGLIRQSWTGFSGGPEVQRLVRRFCAELRGEQAHA